MSIYANLKDKILTLKSLDSQLEVFGSRDHGYRLNKNLEEHEIVEIEEKIGIRLPEEYRNFLLFVGDCEVGPHYGLIPIRKALNKIELKNYYSNSFPHKDKWIDWDDYDDKTNNSMYSEVHNENYIEGIIDLEDPECDYFDDNYKRGSFDICNEGCGHLTLLVISGSERGNIWGDSRCSDEGIYPFKSKKNPNNRLTFLEWYENWLDNNIFDFKLVEKLVYENLSLSDILEHFKKNKRTYLRAEDIISSLGNRKKPEKIFGDGYYTRKVGEKGSKEWYEKTLKILQSKSEKESKSIFSKIKNIFE